MCFLARAAPYGESLRPGAVDWSGGVFASCMPRVQLYVNACNGWPQFALQHHWLLPIKCHFLRLYSMADRGDIAAVSSAIEESDLYLFLPFQLCWLLSRLNLLYLSDDVKCVCPAFIRDTAYIITDHLCDRSDVEHLAARLASKPTQN